MPRQRIQQGTIFLEARFQQGRSTLRPVEHGRRVEERFPDVLRFEPRIGVTEVVPRPTFGQSRQHGMDGDRQIPNHRRPVLDLGVRGNPGKHVHRRHYLFSFRRRRLIGGCPAARQAAQRAAIAFRAAACRSAGVRCSCTA